MAPVWPKKILLITNVERGELNVFLATAQSLLDADPTLDLHLATHADLQLPLPEGIHYHQINGPPMLQAIEEYFSRKQGSGNLPKSFTKPLGFVNTRRAIRDTASTVMPYTGRQMTELFTSIVDIIQDVNPDLVVVDSKMSAGLTACYHVGARFLCLGPNAISEFAAPAQPLGASHWNIPALFSGFTYPVPWHKKLLNAYYARFADKAFKKDPQKQEVQSYLAAHTVLKTPADLVQNRPEHVKILVGSLSQLDFPLKVPSHIIPCGPIVRQAEAVAESDPKLAEWLSEGRTLYVNMGSFVKMTEDEAAEIAQAIKIVIDYLDKELGKARLKVFWKLKKKGKYSVYEPSCKVSQFLHREFEWDRIRVVDWVKAEPISILNTGRIACSVHHGGAGSFNEAITTGTPQVILPVWATGYDYAQRVELLGVGRWGNRAAKPHWSAQELSSKLLEVLDGGNLNPMKKKAVILQQICEQSGNGADCAALAILQECEKYVFSEWKE